MVAGTVQHEVHSLNHSAMARILFHLLLTCALFTRPMALTDTTNLPTTIQEAGTLAYPHIDPTNPQFKLYLTSFAVLQGYMSPQHALPPYTTMCPTCHTQPTQPPRSSPCGTTNIALCLFQCLAATTTTTDTTTSSKEAIHMAHLTLAQAYKRGRFPGQMATHAQCTLAQDTKLYHHHLTAASNYASQYVLAGVAKHQTWVPIYNERKLTTHDTNHKHYGQASETKFHQLEQQLEELMASSSSAATVKEQRLVRSTMIQLAQQIASTKYNGRHGHALHQKQACEWYEKSDALSRQQQQQQSTHHTVVMLASATKKQQQQQKHHHNIVMLAQCYTSGSGGFPVNEAKGVALLRECVQDVDGGGRDPNEEGPTADEATDTQPTSPAPTTTTTTTAITHTQAQCMSLLGTFSLWGMHTVQPDVEEAERLLLLASEKGEAFASYGLGMLYFLGYKFNNDRNYKLAYAHLNQASEQGYMLARVYLASMLMHGQGHSGKKFTANVQFRSEVQLYNCTRYNCTPL